MVSKKLNFLGKFDANGNYHTDFELTRENYFSEQAQIEYMGSTQLKGFVPSFGGCEAKQMAILSGDFQEREKDCFIEGHYAHAWNEGPGALEKFRMEHPELYLTRASTCGVAGDLKANYKHIENIIDMLERDRVIMASLHGEKEVIFKADMFGIPWKVMLDSYNRNAGYFADLKILKSLYGKVWNETSEIHGYENIFEALGYLRQMAIYAEVERISTGRTEHIRPYIVAASKEEIPDKIIIGFESEFEPHGEFIGSQLLYIESHIDRVKDVKYGIVDPVRCERCDYCKQTKMMQSVGITHYSELSIY